MRYYRLFGKFVEGEATFSPQEPTSSILNFYHPMYKLLRTRGIYTVDACYGKNGMSDFLKIGHGSLASAKMQKVFIENGFSGVQFVPAEVHNQSIHLDYAFINPIVHYDLLDPEASDALCFEETLGGYNILYEEILDREKFNCSDICHDLFTLSTYKQSYYVSERVKNKLEAAGVTGIKFIAMEFSS